MWGRQLADVKSSESNAARPEPGTHQSGYRFGPDSLQPGLGANANSPSYDTTPFYMPGPTGAGRWVRASPGHMPAATSPSDPAAIRCGSCRETFRSERADPGLVLICPRCGKKNRIPQGVGTAAATSWTARSGWGTVRRFEQDDDGDCLYWFVFDDGTEVGPFECSADDLPGQQLGEYARGINVLAKELWSQLPAQVVRQMEELAGIPHGLKLKMSVQMMREIEEMAAKHNAMPQTAREHVFESEHSRRVFADAGWAWTTDYSVVKAAPGLRADEYNTPVIRQRPASGAPGERNSRTIPQDVKIHVSARDQGMCVQCGSTEDLHFDHKIPWSRGGTNTVNNIQLLCGPCNRRKGADDIPVW